MILPIEDFFRNPDRVGIQISPGGKRLAYLAPYQRRLNVHVQDLETGTVTRVTGALERDIAGYIWIDDERIAFAQDRGGDENYRLYAVDVDGGNPLDLTPFDEVQCSLIDELEDDPDHIIFQMNHRRKDCFDAYRLNVRTGEMQMVAENDGRISDWVTDHEGRIRSALVTDGVNTATLYRKSESDGWRTLAEYDFRESATPLRFTFDDQRLYIASNVGRDTRAFYELDPETGGQELVFEDPDYDAAELLFSRKRKKLLGAAVEKERLVYTFFDELRERHHRFIEEQLPDREVHFVSRTKDETRFIVIARSDRSRGTYYLFDTEPMKLEKLFDIAPWLPEEDMAPMEPISYLARDGEPIHGYLTLPVGREAKRLPLVVNPHGGPWHRDRWGFNPEVQFLANRGYAVLQMNFRGSTGYGRRFWERSFGQWGLAMQDDVTDGVRWAIDEGIADPARVAIYGGSYGGYATLSGLTRTPDLYACGVSYVGPSNMFTFLNSIPPYWQPYREMLYEMIGHPERDEARLREASPFFQAARIQAPLFVAQGANDPRVKKEESDQIVQALTDRGIQTAYMVKENEGHGFANEENRLEFYHALERFLAEHLQPA